MRSFWSEIPMLRVAFPLMLGIGLEIAFDKLPGSISKGAMIVFLALFIFSVLLLFAFGLIKNTTLAFKTRGYNGVTLTVIILSFGYLLTWFYTQKNYPNHFKEFLQDDSWLVAQIDEPPVIREKVIIANALVKEVRNHSGSINTLGIVQLNFMKDSTMRPLAYGDLILVKSKVEEMSGPKNPDEFNFKNYQGFHNVYHKAFLTRGSWTLLDSSKGNMLLTFIYKIRAAFLKTIAQYVNNRNDFGVASAIMLGYRDYVNADVMRAYASSGTLHVLSVSGLHVGIMFIMLNFLLKWMDDRGRKWVIAKAVFIILFIWFYACLTGLSPPVLRSAMMFSLIQIGRVMIRNVNTYNIITASAILLLLFDPFVLMDVGFQLSYIAVIGIVYLHPKISSLVVVKIPKTKGIKWFGMEALDFSWQLIAISIAAQIATLPLSVLYFYQFPNLFLISNLIVIPLSNLILFTGTALFALSHIPYLGGIAGWCFDTLLRILDAFIFRVDQLPFALVKGISISAIEMVLMYILIFLGCWLTEERKSKVLIAALVVVLGLCSFHSFKEIRNANVKEIVVYSIPKQKAIALIASNKVLTDFDSTLINDQTAMSFHVLHHWWNLGLKHNEPLKSQSFPIGNLVLFEGKRILIVDTSSSIAEVERPHGSGKVIREGFEKDISYYLSGPPLNSDLVIITGNPRFPISKLKLHVRFNEIVFDCTNNARRVKKWQEDCESLGIKYWNVSKQGAYIKDLK